LHWRTMPGRDFNYKVSIGKLPSLIQFIDSISTIFH
jgi:hypothetical protein